ncbi:MAG TPA: DUF3048 domain-containing protein [Candidatus Saccharimonadales bacterium]|nr:DUF3048 domain-containing protein [Candidatus Saccharimonadales bacterium]
MVDDISPQPEDQNKNNPGSDTINLKSGTNPPGQVDSLVVNDIGGIATGKAGKKANRLKKKAHKFLSRGLDLWPSTKNQKIAGSLIIAVLLVGGIGGVYALKNLFSKSPAPAAPVVQKIEEKKTTEPSRLSGVEIPIEVNKRPITAVMIENSPDARPQSGLRHAGIVFEAIAEGGITRFNALYLEGRPKEIGPVRSIRPYYIDLFLPFDAAIAHAGGSVKGLTKLGKLHVKDLDYTKTDAFHRVNKRYAPHNLYTSMDALLRASKAKKFNKLRKIDSWPRKEEAPAKKPAATKIDFLISDFLYDPHFDYDKKSNSYKRKQAGQPHIDALTHKQLSPKVVVALAMDYAKSGIYSVYYTSGKGKMFVFQDGKVHQGIWKKDGPRAQFKFYDSKGKELALNAGQTWVTLVAKASEVKYKR